MKNMFKMMGVALLAGAMLFTACKKDKEETTPATTTTPSVSVTFNGTTWTSEVAMDYTEVGTTNKFDVFNSDGESIMQFGGSFEHGVARSYGMPPAYVVYWEDVDEEHTIEYAINSIDGVIVVSTFDMATTTFSGSIKVNVSHNGTDFVPVEATFTNAKFDIVNE